MGKTCLLKGQEGLTLPIDLRKPPKQHTSKQQQQVDLRMQTRRYEQACAAQVDGRPSTYRSAASDRHCHMKRKKKQSKALFQASKHELVPIFPAISEEGRFQGVRRPGWLLIAGNGVLKCVAVTCRGSRIVMFNGEPVCKFDGYRLSQLRTSTHLTKADA